MNFKNIRFYLVSTLFLAFFSACKHKSPTWTYMPDMAESPALKVGREGANKPPVEGTVPRGFQPYAFSNDPDGAGQQLRNPLRPTASVLARGKSVFEVNCAVCHGKMGEGDGTVVPKFPKPPSLHSEKVRGWPDGRIFHVATMGQNLMPAYRFQVSAADRWAAVHYIRVLQRSKNPSTEDLKEQQAEESQ